MNQRSFVIGVLGALVGAAFFFVVTMDVAVGVILGAPIGLLVAVIGYRAAPRIMGQQPLDRTPLNGMNPPQPTVEEQARPGFKMKLK